MLHDNGKERCFICQDFRISLYNMRKRLKSSPLVPKPTHRLDYMSHRQLKEKCQNRTEEMKGIRLYLTPTLRMCVKLAVQVMSLSVASAFQLKSRNGTSSIECLIRKFDTFFDCLNVSNITTGTYQRKPACAPYVNDWRFDWLEKNFLGFLEEWQQECNNKPNLSAKEKAKMCLSKETLEGLRITVKSFVLLRKELLQIPNAKFLLSERFNQDPLDEYLSKQRGMGGYCDNPTVRQFQHNALRLQVAGAPAVLASSRGNCQNRNIQQLQNEPIQRQNSRK